MGRGDKKTKKGKRFAGSYGRVRVKRTKTKKNFLKPQTKSKNTIVEHENSNKKSTTSKKNTKKKVTKKLSKKEE